MGQCVSRKAGAVFATSSYKIMDKPTKDKNESKGASKRGAPHTRGTSISFGFRRRSRGDANQTSVASYGTEGLPPRSKSVGPEQVRRRIIDEEDRHHRVQSASSGRSTPRLAPPKKELTSGVAVRTNRFGFRQQPPRYTDKVADVCSSQCANHFNQEKIQNDIPRPSSRTNQVYNQPNSKHRASPINNHQMSYTNSMIPETNNRRITGIPEPISKYTLHSSHLPQPQFAVRVNDSNPKITKTAVNQSRKVSTASKGSTGSQSGSGTEDSGVGSHHIDNEICRGMDYLDGASSPRRLNNNRPRNLRMVVSGKSFDVRDIDDDSTVTEISVIPLPKSFATVNLNSGIVRERSGQYQRIVNKDNRYAESVTSMTSMTSMSTTSSEGYDEGLGEEKVYKDRSRSEKVPSIKSDFSPPSSDDPEYGHGEAMADEYSFSSVDECRANRNTQHLKTISNAAKNGSLPKSTLRSVLLTIEDPAFAAAAATSTTFIDDETSPVDSLVDSLTASITQSDGQASRKERIIEKAENAVVEVDDSPGTPTNASNSLSLSEGREYFDDEIADQPGLIFDDTARGHSSARVSQATDHTLIDSLPKKHLLQGVSVESSPINRRRISRTGSVGTLSPCESITSDDLMLDYEQSETSTYNETSRRLDSSPAIHQMDDATILSELEAQGEEVMREWSSLLGIHQQNINSDLDNNNVNSGNNDNNNHPSATTESGIGSTRTSRLLRSRSGTDSPRSQDSLKTRQIASPFRPVFTGNGQSPSLDSGDEGSPRLERCNYHQDIVSIKTGLLKLMRVVQESGDNDLTRAETLNPFSTSTLNGLFNNLNDEGVDTNNHLTNGALNIADEMANLRRQVIFLQGQLEDKDRTIQQLQMQVAKQQDLINCADPQNHVASMNRNNQLSRESCNAATQTEKLRPVSAGPSLLQSLPADGSMGPLVSWSENRPTLMYQRPPSLVELNSSKSPRKTSDRLPVRTVKSRQEHTTSSYSVNKSRETIQNIGNRDEHQNEANGDLKKSCGQCIPALKKLTTPTFIPRVTRPDISVTSRLHNL